MANTAGVLRYNNESWKRAAELRTEEDFKFSFLKVKGLEEVFIKGLRRGSMAAVHGIRSSGRTSLCLQVLAEATSHNEICALVDLHNTFHPSSAEAAGVKLSQVVWVRCGGNAEYAMRASDLLLHAGGFGIITLDLCEAKPRILNRIPLSYWHRFRRALEGTSTVLLVCSDTPQAKSCIFSDLKMKVKESVWAGNPTANILQGVKTYASFSKVSSIRPHPLFLQTGA